MAKKKKYYAVAAGRAIGVFETWDKCQEMTKGYSRAKFKSFPTREEAEAFVAQNRGGQSRPSPSDDGNGVVPAAAAAEPPAKRRRTDSSNGGGETTSIHSSIGAASPSSRSATLSIDIHFDGGSRGNPGIAGAGAEVVVSETTGGGGSTGGEGLGEDNNGKGTATTTKVAQIREYCGAKCTNNVAEYTGLLVGLRCAKDAATDYVRRMPMSDCGSPGRPSGGGGGGPTIRVSVRGDSNLIICQMLGTNECRSSNLKALYGQCTSLVGDIEKLAAGGGAGSELSVFIDFEHVYRDENKVADALANEAMDQRRSWTTTVVRKQPESLRNDNDGAEVIELTSSPESAAATTSRYEDV